MSKRERIGSAGWPHVPVFPCALYTHLLSFLGHLSWASLRAASRKTRAGVERHVRRAHTIDFDSDSAAEPYTGARRAAFDAICAYAGEVTHIGIVSGYAAGLVVLPDVASRRNYNTQIISFETESRLIDLIARNRHTLCMYWYCSGAMTPALLAALGRCPRLQALTVRRPNAGNLDEAMVRGCLDVLAGAQRLESLNSSGLSDDQQSRILGAACAHQPHLENLLLDHVPPGVAASFVGAFPKLTDLSVLELDADPAPLLDALVSMSLLESLALGVLQPHASGLSGCTWSLPPSLTHLHLNLYDALNGPKLRGGLPVLRTLYTHALPPPVVARLVAVSPRLEELTCRDSPCGSAFEYGDEDSRPSTLAKKRAPAYAPTDVIVDALSGGDRRPDLRRISLGTAWLFPNAGDHVLRRLADSCPALERVTMQCAQHRQSCIAYLLAKCPALRSVDLWRDDADDQASAVLESDDEFSRGFADPVVCAPTLRSLDVPQNGHLVKRMAAPCLTWLRSHFANGECDIALLVSRFPTLGHLRLHRHQAAPFALPSRTALSVPVSAGLRDLRLSARVDFAHLFARIAPAFPGVRTLHIAGADAHVLTSLRANLDWFPVLESLAFTGSAARDPRDTTLCDLLRARPALVTLRLRVPPHEVRPVRARLRPFESVSATNPVARHISCRHS